MNLWWAILLLALVLSPLTWLVPSRRQRGQMDLRLQARRLGLAMQMARQEWPHWMLRQPPRSCAQYHCPRRRGRADTWAYWQSEPGVWLDRWREACVDPALNTALLELPGDVFQVEATAQYLALYWGERGDASALQRVAEFMQQQA